MKTGVKGTGVIEIASGTPQPLQMRIAKRIEDCGLDVWDHVTRESPLFVRAPFLQALEDGMPDTLQPRYAILFDKEIPVAVLVGQILALYADRVRPADEGKAKIIQSAMAKLRMDVFMWGNFVGWGYSGIAIAPGVNRTALWPSIAEAIDRARELDDDIRNAALHLVLDLSSEEAFSARHLEEYRFRPMQAETDMILTIPPAWKSFDDYRGALKSKYRKASVEMDIALANAGCRIETMTDIDRHADELCALQLQVHEQSEHRFVTHKREFFAALARRFGDRFICRVVRQDARILGFITTLIDGDTALAYIVGHDVEANRTLPIYLRLLQTAIEDGICHGCTRVTYGRTALEPKARLGAVAVPLTIYGRHKSRVLGPLVSRILQKMAPKEGPPARSPFKESGGAANQKISD